MDQYHFPTDPVAKDAAVVKGDKWRFTILTDGLVRCEWAEDGKFEDRASTFVINRNLEVPKYRVTEVDGVIDIVTDRFQLTYDKTRFSPGSLTINVLSKIVVWGARWRYGDYSVSIGGTARTLDDVDGRCELGPSVIGKCGFSAIDDHDSMLFDGKGWVSGREYGDREDLYVFCYAHDYEQAIDALYKVSGKQPVIPRWALGNWWSRYYAYSAKEYLELMDKFRAHDVPLSVAVLDMDWHLVNDERVAHSGWTGYTWDKKLFPEPQKFLDELHDRKLKVCPNDHPAEGVWSHESMYDEFAKEIGHDTTHKAPIQFDCTSVKFVKAYLKMFTSLGFDFNWIDWQQGPWSRIPGVDPLWVLNHFHFLENSLGGKKGLIFSRYGGPGSHRYPVGFSGDTIMTWDSLNFQPEFTASASNIGYGWWSHDIGGHMFGSRDDEMATRWIQYGVFSPIMRLHSSNSQWTSKEPWGYSKEADAAISDILRFRHKLIPYLYTMNVAGARTNKPLVRPLYWKFPNTHGAYNYPNEFYFGTELLVSSITTPRDTCTRLAGVKTWLPPLEEPGNRWVDIFTGTVYDTDRVISLYRPLEQYAVLAKGGSIIPLDNSSKSTNDTKNPDHIEVLIVPGADASFELIETVSDDEAATAGSKERITSMTWTQSDGRFKLAQTVDGNPVNTSRRWSLRFVSASFTPDASITVNGRKLDSSAPVHDATTPFTTLGPFEIEKSVLEVQISAAPTLLVLPTKDRLFELLKQFQCETKMKERIWDVVTAKEVPASVKVSRMLELDADKNVTGPVLEILLADSRTYVEQNGS